MRRTLILSALGITATLVGFGVGTAVATADPPQPLPIATHTMMTSCPMADMAGMTDMADMADMMQMMMGSSMADEQVPVTDIDHAAHHPEARP